jgi:hypothetical protein
MLRVIHRMIVILSVTAALAALTAGLFSFYQPVPQSGVWIHSSFTKPRVQCAFVNGTLHIVHSRRAVLRRPPTKDKTVAGFSIKTIRVGSTLASGVGVPFWSVSIMFAAYPLMALAYGPWRRRRRRRRGKCIACGYSLRGLPEPRCPECGRPFDPNRMHIPMASATAARSA